jgi:hypothetical protein
MVVKTQVKGSEIIGLLVGTSNVRRYFPKKVSFVEFQLDHLQIRCGLKPEFWRGRPEIRDPRLCEWLDFKIFHHMKNRSEVKLAMIPSGNHTFTLGSAGPGGHAGLGRAKTVA